MAQELTPKFISEDIFRFIPSQLNIEGWGVRSKAGMTRSMIKHYSTMVSCRIWQLVYFVLFYYNKYTHYSFIERLKSYIASYKDISLLKSGSEISKDFRTISNILNFILDKRYANPLYTIVIDGKINKRTDTLRELTSLADIQPYIDPSLQVNIFSCCLYSEIPEGTYKDVYILNHFFNIIYIDDVFYINSAYGSDFVKVLQYSTILSAEEFNNFCSASKHLHLYTIKSPTSSAFICSKGNSYHALEKCEGVKDGNAQAEQVIHDFFIKYFLKGNISLPRPSVNDDDDDDDDDRRKRPRPVDMMSPQEGIQKEITQYINAGKYNTLGVGFIPTYNSLVTTSIDSFLAQQPPTGGRRRKYKKTGKHKKSRRRGKTRKTKKMYI
jgi:hypothetical protein